METRGNQSDPARSGPGGTCLGGDGPRGSVCGMVTELDWSGGCFRENGSPSVITTRTTGHSQRGGGQEMFRFGKTRMDVEFGR